MQITRVQTYRLGFGPGELDLIHSALWDARRISPGHAWDWTDAVLHRLTHGEPLSAEDAHDLRAELLTHLRTRYGGRAYPEPLDSICAELGAQIP